ncbi:malonic semialdehyde reductase [Nocardia sp. 348MFTsu5.1]|uniref:malonic semialdehyde reductase n=1 Tax=Nocardia sp. 348MFTsu5.1 TaxID=1172185 RepID=UPI00036BC710|nr:malonic semialdehyde reductase [Nocardia sp. 348MFTsu5.1]
MTHADTVTALDAHSRELLFSNARTANTFSSEPVSDAVLKEVWELAKWPPTAANTQPLRVLYVRSDEAKERLLPHVAEGNVAKVRSAPVTAVLAMDSAFHEHIPTVLPFRPEMKEVLEANEDMRTSMGTFGSTLQAGYFILAVRSVGLTAGPMAGFDSAGVDSEFFGDGRWKSTLLVNIGHPGKDPWFDRLPRLHDDDVLRFA